MAFSYQVPATVVAGKAPRDECFARDCCCRRPRHRQPLGRQVILLLGSKQNRRPRKKSSEFSSVHLSTGYFIACGPPRSTLTPFFPVAAQCFIYNPSEAVLCCSLPCAQSSSKPKSSSGFFPVCLLIHSAVSTCGFVVQTTRCWMQRKTQAFCPLPSASTWTLLIQQGTCQESVGSAR